MAPLTRSRMTRRIVAATAWLAVAMASAEGNAQAISASPDVLCARALAGRGARLEIPVLTSQPVREASCSCLADAVSGRPAEQSVRAAVAANAGECIARTVPVERVGLLPPAVLAQLEDAYAQGPTARGFSSPKSIFEGCKFPEYPAAARRAEATGRTRIAVHISANSSVIDGEVTKSSGSSPAHKMLDAVALFSIMQCRFEPARLRDQPLDAWTEIEYVWKLE
jgi:TonB family protein